MHALSGRPEKRLRHSATPEESGLLEAYAKRATVKKIVAEEGLGPAGSARGHRGASSCARKRRASLEWILTEGIRAMSPLPEVVMPAGCSSAIETSINHIPYVGST